MISGSTKNIFLGRKKANHTHSPKQLILNNLSTVTVENSFSWVLGFLSVLFAKTNPIQQRVCSPRDAVFFQTTSYRKEYVSWLSLRCLSLKASTQYCLPDPMASPGSIQNASANNGRIRTFHQKSTLIKGVIRQPSQGAGPFLLMNFFQMAAVSGYCLVASHGFSLQSCSVIVLPLAFKLIPSILGKPSLQSSLPQSFQSSMLYSALFRRFLAICTFPLHFKTVHHKGPSLPLHMQISS